MHAAGTNVSCLEQPPEQSVSGIGRGPQSPVLASPAGLPLCLGSTPSYRGDLVPGWHQSQGEGMSCLVSPRSADRRDISEEEFGPR